MTPSLRVRELRTHAELLELAPTWRQLQVQSGAGAFSSHEWALTWFEELGGEGQLLILLVEDDDGPAALAPFLASRRWLGPLRHVTLELLGTGPLPYLGMGLADRADILIARRPEDCLEALFDHLRASRGRDWDVVDLRFLPSESPTAGLLPALCSARDFGFSQTTCARSPYLELVGSYSEHLASRSRNFRKNLGRRRKKLEALGELRFELHAEDRGDLSSVLREVTELSLASWKAEAGSALFQHEPVRQFLEALFPRLQASGGLYLALLRIDGRLVAHELGFRSDLGLASWESAYRQGFEEGSPGLLLTAAVLEESWKDRLGEYDFGRDAHGYKLSWTETARTERQAVFDSGRWKGRLVRQLAYRLKWSAKGSERLQRWHARAVGWLNRRKQGSRSSDA